MAKIKAFIKKEIVLCVSFTAALISCFFVKPDAQYFSYFDFRTLALLYCLMAVVAGFRRAGLFSWLAHRLCQRAGNARVLGLLLTALCFFFSMLITNDVALLTFVPFAIVVLSMAGCEKELIPVVVLQTIAANMGSMLTPVGNPQNLYLFSHYSIDTGEFFGMTLPVWLTSLVLTAVLCILLISSRPLQLHLDNAPELKTRPLPVFVALLVLCLLVVFRMLTWPWMLAILILVLLFYDREVLLCPDFMLLLTFVCFFIFSGNLKRMEPVDKALRAFLTGREYLTAVLCSQVISNVPAALLLSGFTDQARALVLGTDIGGLGTPIASLASLISLKLYSRSEHAQTGRYLALFSVLNFALLVLLSLIFGR